MKHKLFGELIYWVHVALMTVFFFSGFFAPLEWIVLTYLLIELQLYIFDGCGITKFQQKLDHLATDQDFIPALAKRLFKLEITEKQHAITSFIIMAFPLIVALIEYFVFGIDQ